MSDAPLFFLIAGEPSGDLLGARLMQALKNKTGGQARFAGIGGPRMQAEGIELFFPQNELAHFGLFELIRHVPHLLRRMRETVKEVKARKPAALITIDAPDFCFRVAKKLKGQGIPLIHYVAPTVWAWRAGRAKKIAKFLDHLLALLPFEPEYFTREGLACTFVGHPIVESSVGDGDAAQFRRDHNVPEDAVVLTVLPGSRRSEITRLMPVFKKAIQYLRVVHPKLHVVMPSLPSFADSLKAETKDWAAPVTVVTKDQDKYYAFAASKAALACSGTVAVELAMARLPFVVAYKLNAVTYFLYRRLIKVDYACLVNLMHKKEIVPELMQEDCTPEEVAVAVHNLLDDEEERETQIEGLKDVASWLGKGQFVPSERAADTVLEAVNFAKLRKAA